ncbi:hypothetical protein ABVT35_11110 [Hoeflea sp. TYP-13]
MISQAPVTFIVGAVIILVAAYGICRLQFSDRIGTLNERIALKDDTIAQYKDNTGADSPDDARRMIAELEKRLEALEPRALSLQEIEILERELSASAGFVLLARDMVSADSVKLTSQLERSFRKCKWSLNTAVVAGLGFHPPTGVLITTRIGNELSGDAAVVVRAFNEAGIKFDLKKEDQPPPEEKKFKHSVEVLVTNPI